MSVLTGSIMSEIVKLYNSATNKEAFEKSIPTIKDITDYYSLFMYIKKQNRFYKIKKNERVLGKDNYVDTGVVTNYTAADELKKISMPFLKGIDDMIVIKPNKESKINFKKINESIENILKIVNADQETYYKANHQTINNEVVITLVDQNNLTVLNKNYIMFNITDDNGKMIDRLLNSNIAYSKTKKEIKEEKRLEKQKRKELNARTIKGPTGADEFLTAFNPQDTELEQTIAPINNITDELLTKYFIENKTKSQLIQEYSNVDFDAMQFKGKTKKFDEILNEVYDYARDIALNFNTLGADHYKKILKQEKIDSKIQKVIISFAKKINGNLMTLDEILTD